MFAAPKFKVPKCPKFVRTHFAGKIVVGILKIQRVSLNSVPKIEILVKNRKQFVIINENTLE